MEGVLRPSPASEGPNPVHLWAEDPTFLARQREIEGRTLVDPVRCFVLHRCALQAVALPGDAAEIGVYKGGTARLLATTFGPRRRLHLFDTFAGMPPTDPARDLHREGDFADTSLASVEAYLRDCPGVEFHPGFFPATGAPVRDRRFALVHVDVDIYRSVLDCCHFFHPRMEPGGIMVFDDYGFRSCPGARAAVDEFFADRPETPLYLPTGQCLVTRLPGSAPRRRWFSLRFN